MVHGRGHRDPGHGVAHRGGVGQGRRAKHRVQRAGTQRQGAQRRVGAGRGGAGHRDGVGLGGGAVLCGHLHLDGVGAGRQIHLLAVRAAVRVGQRVVAAVEVGHRRPRRARRRGHRDLRHRVDHRGGVAVLCRSESRVQRAGAQRQGAQRRVVADSGGVGHRHRVGLGGAVLCGHLHLDGVGAGRQIHLVAVRAAVRVGQRVVAAVEVGHRRPRRARRRGHRDLRHRVDHRGGVAVLCRSESRVQRPLAQRQGAQRRVVRQARDRHRVGLGGGAVLCGHLHLDGVRAHRQVHLLAVRAAVRVGQRVVAAVEIRHCCAGTVHGRGHRDPGHGVAHRGGVGQGRRAKHRVQRAGAQRQGAQRRVGAGRGGAGHRDGVGLGGAVLCGHLHLDGVGAGRQIHLLAVRAAVRVGQRVVAAVEVGHRRPRRARRRGHRDLRHRVDHRGGVAVLCRSESRVQRAGAQRQGAQRRVVRQARDRHRLVVVRLCGRVGAHRQVAGRPCRRPRRPARRRRRRDTPLLRRHGSRSGSP